MEKIRERILAVIGQRLMKDPAVRRTIEREALSRAARDAFEQTEPFQAQIADLRQRLPRTRRPQ